MSNIRLLLLYFSLLWTVLPSMVISQEKEFLAIIPAFHYRENQFGNEMALQLAHQRFVLFVYRNAVAVYSEADFVNNGSEPIVHELALPSTGHDENGEAPGGKISSGILSIQMSVEGERVSPKFINDGNEDWCTISLQLNPNEMKKVKAMFWAQTSLTDVDSLPGLDTVPIPPGKRGFLVDISHAAVWSGNINSLVVSILLKGGMTLDSDSFSVEPSICDLEDSTIDCSFTNIESSLSDNIIVMYTTSGRWRSTTNTMAKLSNYIVKKVYDQLLEYVSKINE